MIQQIVSTILLAAVPLYGADPVRAILSPKAERRVAEPIKLSDSTGKLIDLASYRGHVVLVDFWATWCGGCKQELPWFQEFHAKYTDRRFSVVAVSMDEEGWAVVTPFLKPLKLSLRMVMDDGATSQRYGFKEMPAAFLIDRQGRLAARYIGLVDRSDIETNIKLLLSERQ